MDLIKNQITKHIHIQSDQRNLVHRKALVTFIIIQRHILRNDTI